jgi:serine/threonine protein kinase
LHSPIYLEARDLIKALLERNPKKRLTVAQALKHPWLAKAETKSKMLKNLKRRIVNIFNDGEKLIIKKEINYSEGDDKKRLDTFIHQSFNFTDKNLNST